MSFSQPIASICAFSSSVRYFSASFFSHSAGISAVSIAWSRFSSPLNVAPKTRSNLSIALVLHQGRAREIIEIVNRSAGEIGVERAHQRQIFAQRDRDLRLAERGEEIQE